MFTLSHKSQPTTTKVNQRNIRATSAFWQLQKQLRIFSPAPSRPVKWIKAGVWISAPLKTRLPNPKKICPRRNTPNVNIDPQAGNVIIELCRARGAQNLVAGLSE